MERLWNHKSAINWQAPIHWGKLTAAQMRKDPKFDLLKDQEIILLTDGVDIVYDFRFLEDWKAAYEVDIEDPQEALDEIIRIRNTPHETFADLQQQVEFQAQALEELITLTLEQ